MMEYSAKETILLKEWKFALVNNIKGQKIKPGKWYSASVPGTVHTDLLKNKFIDDPYFADNELKLEWIDRCDWIYKTELYF